MRILALCLVLCTTSLAGANKRAAELKQMRDEVTALGAKVEVAAAAPLTTEEERATQRARIAELRKAKTVLMAKHQPARERLAPVQTFRRMRTQLEHERDEADSAVEKAKTDAERASAKAARDAIAKELRRVEIEIRAALKRPVSDERAEDDAGMEFELMDRELAEHDAKLVKADEVLVTAQMDYDRAEAKRKLAELQKERDRMLREQRKQKQKGKPR